MQTPGISIVICARNEAENLRRNLPKVLEQDHPCMEVIVVDDASEDDSGPVLQQLKQRYPALRVLRIAPKTHPGKKQALAQGIAHSRYDLILLTDADCFPATAAWARTMSGYFAANSHTEIVLGFGPYIRQPGYLNAWIRYETICTAFRYATLARLGRPYMGVGRNLAWKKSVFMQHGGFDKHLQLASGDDDLFVNAAGNARNTRVCFDADAVVFSEAPRCWSAWRRQKSRHLSAGKAYKLSDKLLLAGLAFFPVQYYLWLLLLILTNDSVSIVLYLYCIRIVSLVISYYPLISKTRENDLFKWLPLLDLTTCLFYSIYIPYNIINHNQKYPWK